MRTPLRSVSGRAFGVWLAALWISPCLCAQTDASSLPQQARYAMSAAIGRDCIPFHATPDGDGFRVANGAHGFSAEFARGVEVRFDGRRLALALEAVGYGTALQPVRHATPSASANRVEFRCARLCEWYVNGPFGLQQGFTLERAPEGPRVGPLTLELSLEGDFSASVDGDARGMTLASARGCSTLRYAGLLAYDASGRHLDARLEIEGRKVRLRVDDEGARYPVVVDPFVEKAKLTASDGADRDLFGSSAAVSGDVVVVGANFATVGSNTRQGAAYVFERPSSGWVNATETAKLTASDGTNHDFFGVSVAVSDAVIVVGAMGADLTKGAAYVFERPATGWASGTETAKLTASARKTSDYFGGSAAITGRLHRTVIVIGANQPSFSGTPGAGAAYVFTKSLTGWVSATETAKLTASDGLPGDGFGFSVANDLNAIVVGATGADGAIADQGAAYVFERPFTTGWVNATENAKLTASDGAMGDLLGKSVGLYIDTIAVGAWRADIGTNMDQGAVYVFERSSTRWASATETAKLTASDGRAHDHLGWSVAIHHDHVIAGAQNAHPVGTGAAYVFEEPTTGWVSATENTKLTASDGGWGDHFGTAVAVEGDTLVVGAGLGDIGGVLQGACYVFATPASYAPFGSGCSGSNGVPSLAACVGSLPLLGRPFCAELSSLPPVGPAFLFTAFTPYPPAPLDFIGMTGCTLLVNPSIATALFIGGSTAQWLVQIPNDATLLGSGFYHQGFVFDPGVNPFGATTSNAARAVIGR